MLENRGIGRVYAERGKPRLYTELQPPSLQSQAVSLSGMRSPRYIDSILAGPMPLPVNDIQISFEFSLPRSEFDELAPREISSGRGLVLRGYCEESRRVRFRVCEGPKDGTGNIAESEWSALPTIWPPVIVITVNDTRLLSVRRKQHGHDLPCDITMHLNPGRNNLSVVVAKLTPGRNFYGAVEACTAAEEN